ncbi:hypothetical protein IFJ75_00765 [Brevundimonas goettingensis]|uniref:Uncharacterized protein n=2 Tax=Brevundimonas goettingensis TaxID=2774190 RepID=A0A975C3F1_9CAUL|nr:hypothetical protein IFJ75_00765 [Brevundimonas goettingensis]
MAGVALTALSGCASVTSRLGLGQADQAELPPPMPGVLEPIHAAALLNNTAVFWVSSNGCTKKDDLQPIVSFHGDASIITLRRISEDRCTTPEDEGVEIKWSFEELGLKPGARVSVNNPYQLPQT